MAEGILTVFKMHARGWISMYGYNGRFITSMPLLIPTIPMSATFYTLSPLFLSLNHTSYPLNLSRLYLYFHCVRAYHVSTMPTSSLTLPVHPPISPQVSPFHFSYHMQLVSWPCATTFISKITYIQHFSSLPCLGIISKPTSSIPFIPVFLYLLSPISPLSLSSLSFCSLSVVCIVAMHRALPYRT